MKRSVAVVLLFVHLFNIGGMLAVRQFLVYKTDKFYSAQTGKNLYNVNELTEIMIPAAMPGIAPQQDYLDVSGRVDFSDASYNYVKMKITAEGIYLKCIPNYTTTRLNTTNVISAKHIKDIPVRQKDHVPFGKMKIMESFKYSFVQFAFNAVEQSPETFIIRPVHGIYSQALDIPEQPPQSLPVAIG